MVNFYFQLINSQVDLDIFALFKCSLLRLRNYDEPDAVSRARQAKMNEKSSPARSGRQTGREIITLQCDKCCWMITLLIKWVGLRGKGILLREVEETSYKRGHLTCNSKDNFEASKVRETVKNLPDRGKSMNKGSEVEKWHFFLWKGSSD